MRQLNEPKLAHLLFNDSDRLGAASFWTAQSESDVAEPVNTAGLWPWHFGQLRISI
jgi:hypothetical protein